MESTEERYERIRKKKERNNKLNAFNGQQWAAASISIREFPDVRSAKQKQHGAAFPQSLATAMVEMYSRPGDLVLDPFAGVGTTLDAAVGLDRRAFGIELNPEFASLAQEDLETRDATVIVDDVANLLQHLEPETVDFIMTSPPYANLLDSVQSSFGWKPARKTMRKVKNAVPYSEDERDLGNKSFQDYFTHLEKVFKDTFTVARDNTYAVWVVKDFRQIKQKVPFVPFHLDVLQCAEKVGWIAWDISIYDQTRFRPLVVLGYPSRNYYLNIGHSYILVFKKDSRYDRDQIRDWRYRPG